MPAPPGYPGGGGYGAAATAQQTAPASAPLVGSGGHQQSAYLNIRKFNVREQLPFNPMKRHGPIVICVGRRNTGKSEIIKDICFQFHQDVKRVFVMSGTEACSPFFRNFVPPICIRHKYQPAVASKIVDDQYQKCMSFYERVDAGAAGANSEDHRIMWIIDDCMYDDTWAKTELMRYIFTCGRHIKIFLLVSMQYPCGIPPMLRGNVDAVFLTRDMGSNIRRLFELYGSGIFDNFEEFKLVFMQLTTQYSAMVLYMAQVQDTRLSATVFSYKATLRSSFRMGTQRDWDESEAYLHDEQRKQMDASDEYQVGMNKQARRGDKAVRVQVFAGQ